MSKEEVDGTWASAVIFITRLGLKAEETKEGWRCHRADSAASVMSQCYSDPFEFCIGVRPMAFE